MIMKNLKVMMFMFVVSVVLQVAYGKHHIRCLPMERDALLQFKAAIVDRYAMLSSWTTPDCCRWEGIRCSNLTAHVLSLHLPGQYHEELGPYMSGKIHKSLMELPQLMYLNLSSNSFRGSHIPRFIASLINLRYLDLSSCDFSGQIPTQISSLSHLKYLNLARNYYLEGSIPPQLGNLSRLQYLDLRGNSLEGYIPFQLGNLSNLHNLYLGGYNNALRIVSDQWLSNLISLTHLSFQSISNFNTSPTWLRMIAKLPKLRELSLIGCGLSDHFFLSFNPSNFNFSTSLSVLRLSENSFIQPMIFQWVSNTTSNLVELDLHGNLLKVSGSIPNRFGSAMISLKHLDLSYNDFKSENMKSIMNICTLRSLDMSGNNMTEDLSSILHTFSSGCLRYLLQDLNLANNQITGFISDLSLFSSLKSLDISSNRLSGKIREGTGLPSKLEHLSIGSNSLEGGIPKSFGNTCHLKSLDFAYNKLSEDLTIIFNHLSGCSRYSLRELYLRENKFNGTLPDFSMFPELKVLDLSSNQLKNGVPKSLRNATILQILNLSNNSLSEKFPTIIHHLSRYARDSLQHLYLSMNQISGTLPNTLAIFPSLKILNLGSNMLNGTIYEDFQFPIDLEELYLGSNSLKGVITDSHFHNMSKLRALVLSHNSLALEFSQNWNPFFQLHHIGLRRCRLGPFFPKWLQTQNEFNVLDISNNEISDIVPKWFWAKLTFRDWIDIDISYNNLQGVIPNLSAKNYYYSLILASNQFEGLVPSFLRGSMYLDLSNNEFTDSLWFLCSGGVAKILYQLDLSNNKFSGQIPDCWTNFKSLTYLNMSQNKFSGKIPTSMGSLLELQVLLLRNNNLIGEIPSFLKNCSKLVMLDMTQNKLSGSIPTWIGSEISELQFLSLRSNYFNGSLPLQICYLTNIKLLDLSSNKLSGKVPKCFNNFSSMAQMNNLRDYQDHQYWVNTSYLKGNISYNLNAFLMWKGSEQMFTNKGLLLLKSIDLSNNQFSGVIPKEIENLFELVSLNLSKNHLTGEIPSNIGELTSLEFLDLSRNQLIGSIPLSLAQINRLTVLDLSHNYLSGKIPTGTQLQSFNASKYEGNVDLCGSPLKKLCIDKMSRQESHVKLPKDDNLIFNYEFYVSMIIGFIISFLGVFIAIFITHS